MRGQKDLKSMKMRVNWIENQRENWYKILYNTFWWKIRLTLGPSISGTKCDRDKLIFFAEKGVNQIALRYKIGTQYVWKFQKRG